MKGVGQVNPSCILTFARDNNSELIFKAVKDYEIPVDWSNGVGCHASTSSLRSLISTGLPCDGLLSRYVLVLCLLQIGQTALHVAALHGNLEASLALLELGMDVNMTNLRGSTPLHFAAAAKRNTVQI